LEKRWPIRFAVADALFHEVAAEGEAGATSAGDLDAIARAIQLEDIAIRADAGGHHRQWLQKRLVPAGSFVRKARREAVSTTRCMV